MHSHDTPHTHTVSPWYLLVHVQCAIRAPLDKRIWVINEQNKNQWVKFNNELREKKRERPYRLHGVMCKWFRICATRFFVKSKMFNALFPFIISFTNIVDCVAATSLPFAMYNTTARRYRYNFLPARLYLCFLWELNQTRYKHVHRTLSYTDKQTRCFSWTAAYEAASYWSKLMFNYHWIEQKRKNTYTYMTIENTNKKKICIQCHEVMFGK